MRPRWDRYAWHMLAERQTADAIRFVHMDAQSSAVALNVHVGLHARLMAASPYRLASAQVGMGRQRARAQTLFRK